jgi:pimeloyl-ACP methyl ester carboxylesterase
MKTTKLIVRSALAVLLLHAALATAATLGGKLELDDEGIFFVNGQTYRSEYPGASLRTGPAPAGNITVNQMYVHFRIPSKRTGVPIVLVHGSQATGASWETTPDGREGWATWFTRQGHPVYVVDHAGRGRSGFNPTPVNAVRDGGADPKGLPTLFLGPLDRAWQNYRFGPKYPEPFPNLQFPLSAIDQYTAQLVPNTETTLKDGGRTTINALAALLDKIGPAVIVVHSQSGDYGMGVVTERPKLVKALISIEGACEALKADAAAKSFRNVPFLSVFGDNSVGAWGNNGDQRRNNCIAAAKMITAAGGTSTFYLLPELGIKGNSHMMMMDGNNLEVAQVLRKWIAENVK